MISKSTEVGITWPQEKYFTTRWLPRFDTGSMYNWNSLSCRVVDIQSLFADFHHFLWFFENWNASQFSFRIENARNSFAFFYPVCKLFGCCALFSYKFQAESPSYKANSQANRSQANSVQLCSVSFPWQDVVLGFEQLLIPDCLTLV